MRIVVRVKHCWESLQLSSHTCDGSRMCPPPSYHHHPARPVMWQRHTPRHETRLLKICRAWPSIDVSAGQESETTAWVFQWFARWFALRKMLSTTMTPRSSPVPHYHHELDQNWRSSVTCQFKESVRGRGNSWTLLRKGSMTKRSGDIPVLSIGKCSTGWQLWRMLACSYNETIILKHF